MFHILNDLKGVQAYLAGLTFALAASPCSTPVLATLLGYVATSKVTQNNVGSAFSVDHHCKQHICIASVTGPDYRRKPAIDLHDRLRCSSPHRCFFRWSIAGSAGFHWQHKFIVVAIILVTRVQSTDHSFNSRAEPSFVSKILCVDQPSEVLLLSIVS